MKNDLKDTHCFRSKDTPILAADGSTILAVANDPEQHVVRGTVILETKEAKLQVTRDHRIVLASGQLAPLWQSCAVCGNWANSVGQLYRR